MPVPLLNPPSTDLSADRGRRQAFVLVVYRVPARPTANRVAVWRQLKKLGAVYLQQSVCVFPESARTRKALAPVLAKIEESGGTYHLLPLRNLPSEEWDKLVSEFRAQAAKQYDEIVENCEVDFQREIEFETFRKNFTYEEAEEIRADFEKIVAWLTRIRERDLFDSPGRSEAEAWVARCEQMLEGFELHVYQIHQAQQTGRGEQQRAAGDDSGSARMSGADTLTVLRSADEPPEEGGVSVIF